MYNRSVGGDNEFFRIVFDIDWEWFLMDNVMWIFFNYYIVYIKFFLVLNLKLLNFSCICVCEM